MNLLPQPSGARPRIACEITSQGVVAARADAPAAALASTARITLADGAVQPGLRPGNLVDRLAVVTALRRALEDLGLRSNSRNVSVTLVVPDAAVRVLLLDFDALPTKLTEALPLVRFRLKKLLPFDAETAAISYQVMRATRSLVRVLAVAMPRDVLSEYESALREAGFEPGAVLSSTLAALAGWNETGAALMINATSTSVTAAIADEALLLLHRSVDLQTHLGGLPAEVPAAIFEPAASMPALPLMNLDDTQAEWAAQEPLPEHGRNPYADRAGDERAVQNEDGIPQLATPRFATAPPAAMLPLTPDALPGELFVGGHAEPAPMVHSADALPAGLHGGLPQAHASMQRSDGPATPATAMPVMEPAVAVPLSASERDQEVAEAVSIAAAYFEDTLGRTPLQVISIGPMGAEGLDALLRRTGVAMQDGLEVRDAVTSEHLLASATTVPRSWLAAVAGALRA